MSKAFLEPGYVEAAVRAIRGGHNQYCRMTGIPELNRAIDWLSKEKIEHAVLNAKQHAREAQIVAEAGRRDRRRRERAQLDAVVDRWRRQQR